MVRRRVPARQARQGPGLRADEAQGGAVRQGRRQDLQRGHQGRVRQRRQARRCSTSTRTGPTSSSWTPTPTTRSTSAPTSSGRPRTTCWRTRTPSSPPTTGRRSTSSCRRPWSSRSRIPSPACRATGPPAAPSRPPSRPARRSRPAVPRDRYAGQGRHPRRLLPRPRQLTRWPLDRKPVSARWTCCSRPTSAAVNVTTLLADRQADSGDQPPLNPYSVELVEGVVAHWAEIDELLTTYSHGWTLPGCPASTAPSCGSARGRSSGTTTSPTGVAISEAVELARSLSTDDSPGFVNGLLARLAEVKPTLV